MTSIIFIKNLIIYFEIDLLDFLNMTEFKYFIKITKWKININYRCILKII